MAYDKYVARQVSTLRSCAVAGTFYPDDPVDLRKTVQHFIAAAPTHRTESKPPQALIGPHAGYQYSGPIAGSAYAPLPSAAGRIRRVVIMGPAHRVSFSGLATVSVPAFDSPLGEVPVDQPAISAITNLPDVIVHDGAHEYEHGLEVHLPFITETLGHVAIVPVLFGQVSYLSAAQLFDSLWSSDTMIVVSSDLSHYHDHQTATELDRQTADAIESNRPDRIGPQQACGHTAIRGLLTAAGQRGLHAHCVDLRNSGDTAGPKERVVGYGAFHFN